MVLGQRKVKLGIKINFRNIEQDSQYDTVMEIHKRLKS